jgi:hypothetical protein
MRKRVLLTFAVLIAVYVAAVVGVALAISGANAATTGITDRLSADHTSIEVTSEPTGTGRIHVAIMQNLSGAGVKYLDIPASQLTYTPPAADPVVDVIAETSSGATIGGWAGRIQTTPGGVKEEPPKEEEHPSAMTKALDTGGWVSESIAQDFSGAAKHFRARSSYYNSDAAMGDLAKAGVQLMPLFRWGEAQGILAWFQRYGKGGTFWAGKTDLGATTAEIVNEPGNPYEGGSTTNQPQYAAYVEEVNRALSALPEARRPRLLVSFDGGFAGDEYGRILVKDDPNLLKLNIGWTVHPYGGHGSNSALGGQSRVREALHPVYVTEVGWPTAVGQPPTGDSLQWTEAQQAENIVNFVRWARSLGYVNDVTIFNGVDYGSNDWYGVERGNRSHKPSFAALAGA